LRIDVVVVLSFTWNALDGVMACALIHHNVGILELLV